MTKRQQAMLGTKYGRLTVCEIINGGHTTKARAICRCDCGEYRSVTLDNLRSGNSRSCGCSAIEHGFARYGHMEPEYIVWLGMKERCHNPKSSAFKNYGARGIVVCEEWRRSFVSFVTDMGRRPSEKHTVERNDNDGPYAPWNCRWATRSEQMRNTRCTKLSAADVGVIRMMRSGGRSFREIGEFFGITPAHAGQICRGKKWAE